MGSDEHLQIVRDRSNLPILRKDFIVDEYQVYETALLGGDCILLILAMLDDKLASEIEAVAIDCGLSVLIEVHNISEMERATKMRSTLIGINNRDLKTFQTNISTSVELMSFAPRGHTLVSESGITSLFDVDLLVKNGIGCFLIGEYFLSSKDISSEVKAFTRKTI